MDIHRKGQIEVSKTEITANSQLKSANAESDIENHSGKENRGKYKHANENIDKTKSHQNVEFDILDRDELLDKHYSEKIAKHNKNNNSAARRWDTTDDYLATFEGKKVKSGGVQTNNERWATASQLSYFGGTDSLKDVLDDIQKAGASQEEIIEAYSSGYKEYIEKHNEDFPTLPIYHSDIHFDESIPHGHDAIVVMGHTKKGNASESINNALSEKYGYAEKKGDKWANSTFDNMKRYREDNDKIIYDSISPKLEGLAKKHGLDVDFEFIRTGAEGGKDMPEFKRNKKHVEKEKALYDREQEIIEKESELNAKDLQQQQTQQGLDAREHNLREERRKYLEELNKGNETREQKRALLEEQIEDLEEQTESLRFKADFTQSVVDSKPNLMSRKEINELLGYATDGQFSMLRNKQTNDYDLVDKRGEKPVKTDLQTVVGSVYNMQGEGVTLDMEYDKTRRLSFAVGHYNNFGNALTDKEAYDEGFESVSVAVHERQVQIETERSV